MPATLNNTSTTPTATRIPTVDIVRGFALFGILVVNLTTFRSPNPVWHGLDSVVDWLILVLFQSKFLSLYSFLFGLSFALFMRKSTDRSTLWRFAWRTAILLVIGALHYVLLWDGDILMEYAIAAFLLLPFARRKAQTALSWGVGLYAFYALFLLVVVVVSAARPQPQATASDAVDLSVMPTALAQTGSYLQLLQWRAGSVGNFLGEHIAASIFLVGIFLIGVYAGREGIIADPFAHTTLLKRMIVWGLPIGLLCNVVYALAGPVQKNLPVVERAVVIVVIALAPIILALAYAAGAAWLAAKARWMSPLAAAGRMSLTNYLVQSAVMTTLFYTYGFKLFDQVGPTAGLLLAIGIFTAQVILSNLWFRRFSYGPAEWVWRCLTYGKWIKITTS
ncbi:MAG: DUF418 domain-containing protein [Anaerolineae bacterium]